MTKKNNNDLKISVIVPTYNRKEILKKTILGFENQKFPKDKFEVVVVDDGSVDGTKREVNRLVKEVSFRLKYFYQENKGPAAARNLGIKKAAGEIILIINDDTVPGRNLLNEHFLSHKKYPQENYGVLGYLTWDHSIKITPFMKWLENGGPQFSYGKIKGKFASFNNFWTCNVSLKRDFLKKSGYFDESFPYAAWEDIELGYRLDKKGLKLIYNKRAIGYHCHPTSLFSVIDRMKKHGFSAAILGEKINETKLLPPLARPKTAKIVGIADKIIFNKLIEKIFFKTACFAEKKWQLGFIYDLLLLHYRVIGRREYTK